VSAPPSRSEGRPSPRRGQRSDQAAVARRERRRTARAARLLALVGVCVAVTLLTGPVDAAPSAPRGVDVEAGGTLYQRYCALCHNADGSGLAGTGVTAGPDLRGLDVAYVDLVMRTGRMPIVHPEVGATEERLTDDQRVAVVAWMTQEMQLTGQIPDVPPGDAGRGQPLWLTNCAPCHGAAGSGGVAGDGTLAPDVTGIDATGIVEALRVGPFEMPQFGDEVLHEQEAADVAAYVQELADAETTPLAMSEIGRVYAGVATGLLTLALVGLLVVVTRMGRRAGPAAADGPHAEAEGEGR
jgi:ubiquinol-cytochrome c reductase cytochrome c subunit